MKATVATTNPAGFGQIFASPPREFRSPGQVVAELLRAATANIVAALYFNANELAVTVSGNSGIIDYLGEVTIASGVRTEQTRTAYSWTFDNDGADNNLVSPVNPLSVPAFVDYIANLFNSGDEFVIIIDQIEKVFKVLTGTITSSNVGESVATFQLSEGNTWE